MAQTPAIFRQDGHLIDYTPGADVAQGAVVLLGTNSDLVAIAPHAIAANVQGALAAGGVWELPKTNADVVLGDAIYWDADANPLGGDAGSGAAVIDGALGPYAGRAVKAAGTTVGTVLVRLETHMPELDPEVP